MVDSVKINGDYCTLTRERDGAGDVGRLSCMNVDGVWASDMIRVGSTVRVGACRTTMFGADTYWTTTAVTEILEYDVDEETGYGFIKFKTGNSVYVLVGS